MTDKKDRLVQTRIDRELETRLKEEADRRRISVSQFIRNLLEDTLDLVDGVLTGVDDIVADSRDFADQVRREAVEVARTVQGVPPPSAVEEASLDGVEAWNPVVLNRPASCGACHARIEKGSEAYMGLRPGLPSAWLCSRCLGRLRNEAPAAPEEPA